MKVRMVNKEWLFEALSVWCGWDSCRHTQRPETHWASLLYGSPPLLLRQALTAPEAHRCTWAGWVEILRDLPTCTIALSSSLHPHCPGWVHRPAPPGPALYVDFKDPNLVVRWQALYHLSHLCRLEYLVKMAAY